MSISEFVQKYSNLGLYPIYHTQTNQYEIPKGYILFRCHPSDTLTPIVDPDTGKFGCYFCDNCPRLSLSMVWEHYDIDHKFPDGLLLSVYRVHKPMMCSDDKYKPGNSYTTDILSLVDWITSNPNTPDSDLWCHEVFLEGKELNYLEPIDHKFITPDMVGWYYCPDEDFEIDWDVKDRQEEVFKRWCPKV